MPYKTRARKLFSILAFLVSFASHTTVAKFQCSSPDVSENKLDDTVLFNEYMPLDVNRKPDDPVLWRNYVTQKNEFLYAIGEDLNGHPRIRREISLAISLLNEKLGDCIDFTVRKQEKHFVKFTYGKERGCSSAVGRQGGRQLINARGDDYGCSNVGITHEILHSL
eukprot:Awhi_evm1s5342